MTVSKLRLATAIAGALLVGAAIGTTTSSFAQRTPASAAQTRPLPSRHIEGQIAFLRAELKITAAQQAEWDRVAGVMRANANQRDLLVQERRTKRGQPQSAVERLDQRLRATEAHLAAEKSFAEAFKPLYAALSDDQKKSADELFGGYRHRGWRR